MEGILASLGIKLDVLVAQIINLIILFLVFKYFVGNKLSAALQERKAKLLKLEEAEEAYAELIAQANTERDVMIADASQSKKNMIEEAKQLAEAKKAEIISLAQQEAATIKAKADQAQKAQSDELYSNFESMVKSTAAAALKKLIPGKTDAHQSYVQEITVK